MIACTINYLIPSFITPGDYFSYIFAITLMLGISLMILTMTLIIIFRKMKDKFVKDEAVFNARFGSYFLELRQYSVAPLLFHLLFILHRVIFCLSILFLADYPSVQIILFIFSSLA
jgi:hypothetical protein